MKFSDIFKEDAKDRLSINKLWFNIGNLIYSGAFVLDTIHHELTADKSLAYGAIVIGSGLASKLISRKYEHTDVDNDTPKRSRDRD